MVIVQVVQCRGHVGAGIDTAAGLLQQLCEALSFRVGAFGQALEVDRAAFGGRQHPGEAVLAQYR